MEETKKEMTEATGEQTVEQTGEVHEHVHHHTHGEHHHHHHHHHRHRSHRKKKNAQKGEKVARFFRQNKKYLLYSVIAIVLACCLLLLGGYLDRQGVFHHKGDDKPQGGQNVTAHTLQLSVPYFAEEVTIVGPAVAEFTKAAPDVAVSAVYERYRVANARLDVGLAVKLSYELSDLPSGIKVTSARFLVSEDAELREPQVYTPAEHQTAVDVYHLKTATAYYYRVDLTFSDGNVASVGGNFRTADTPRVLTVDGVYNLRDIGGWKTVSGTRVKQGLLYRGCELDGAVEEKYTITPDGVHTMLSVLGIKTDMDLRLASDNVYGTNALGVGVKHSYYEAPMYSAVFDNAEKGACHLCRSGGGKQLPRVSALHLRAGSHGYDLLSARSVARRGGRKPDEGLSVVRLASRRRVDERDE